MKQNEKLELLKAKERTATANFINFKAGTGINGMYSLQQVYRDMQSARSELKEYSNTL